MNLASLIAPHAQNHPERPAIIAGDSVITYAAFDRLVRRIAARLRAAGIGAGDLVGVLMRDTPEQVAAVFAVAQIGAIVLPLDWRSTAPEIARATQRMQPKAILSDDADRVVAPNTLVGIADIERTEPDPGDAVERIDQPFVHLLTSGTTGEPKVMVVTHEQMIGRFKANWDEYPIRPTDRVLPALPMAYASGMNKLASTLCIGATLVMFPTMSQPAEILQAVSAFGIDVLILPPNIIRSLLALPNDPGGNVLMPKLRLLVSATAGLQSSERAHLRAHVARDVIGDYGTTGSGPVAMLRAADDVEDAHATGRPVEGMTVEIVDDDDRPVETGVIGLVRLRGAGVITRMISDQPASDEGLRDGWYYPGDLGLINASGLLCLRGRTADLIKTGGLMVYSQEVERALLADPRVQEAAVIGVPSAQHGETVVAFVILQKSATPKQLIAQCRRHLASHKVPKQVTILESFPRNTNGKVLKAELLTLAQTQKQPQASSP